MVLRLRSLRGGGEGWAKLHCAEKRKRGKVSRLVPEGAETSKVSRRGM